MSTAYVSMMGSLTVEAALEVVQEVHPTKQQCLPLLVIVANQALA